MDSSPSPVWFADLMGPLYAKFGDSLRLNRLGNTICWAYDGQSAVVELDDDGTLRATFIGPECLDAVSARPAAAVYRTRGRYSLDANGARRMSADLADFFSGEREPRFTFVDAYAR